MMRPAELLRAVPVARPELARLPVYEPGRAAPPGAVKLASNENACGPSPKIRKALKSFSAWERYPDGSSLGLRMALSGRLGVLPEEILVGAGSDEIGDFLARAFLRPKDAVVYPKYTFIRYGMAAMAAGARRIETGVNTDFSVDLEDLIRAIRAARPRMVCLANPNNPTAAVLRREEFLELAKHVPPSCLFVVDEAYYEYAVLAADYPDSLLCLKKYPNMVVLRTFSKIYGLASLRVGFAVANVRLISELHKVRPPFNVSAIGQMAAILALEDQDHVWRCAQKNVRERDRLTAALESLGFRVHTGAANFVLVDLRPRAGRDVFPRLARKGLVVRTLDPYGLPHHIRITIGSPKENDRLLAAMESLR